MVSEGELRGELIAAAQHLAATTVGERLREHRIRSGLTAESLAERLNIDPRRLEQVEAGSDRLSVSELMTLGSLFNVPVSSFFGEPEPSPGGQLDLAQLHHEPREHRPPSHDAGTSGDTALAVEIIALFLKLRDPVLRRTLVSFLSAAGAPDEGG